MNSEIKAEREPPKVFGRPMIPTGNGRWLLNIGMLTLVVEHYDGGFALGWSCEVIGQPYMVGSDLLSGLDEAVEWLESNARRIMRECFEIAGPMVAICNEREPEVFDGLNIQKHYQVRFR